MEHQYHVLGKYKNKKVDEIVSAYSSKQAKLRAGFKCGIGGPDMKHFIKSSTIKVRRKK